MRKSDFKYFLFHIICLFVVTLCICVVVRTMTVYGENQNQNINEYTDENLNEYSQTYSEEILEEYDFSEINDALSKNEYLDNLDFVGLVKDMIKGEGSTSFWDFLQNIKASLEGEVTFAKTGFLRVLIIAVMAAIFSNTSSMFPGTNLSENGFYMAYMLLMSVLLSVFIYISDIAGTVIENLFEFMQALIPAYFLSVAVVSPESASGFYIITLLVIEICSFIILKIILPLIKIYVLILMLNNVSKKDYFSKSAGLVKTIINWVLKSIMAVVIGINVIKGLILPSLDTTRSNMAFKLAGMLPGIGNSVSSFGKILVSSGILIKNSIGAASLVLIILICIIPIIKIAFFSLIYQVLSAILQPISDKRIIDSQNSIVSGSKLLITTIFDVVVLFMVCIALVCMTTNVTM